MTTEVEKDVRGRISMRPVTNDDEEFLIKLYASTREDDLLAIGLPEEMAGPLVEMQRQAQLMQYEAEYPGFQNEIVLFDGIPVGRLMSVRNEKEVLGLDLAIMTEYRSHGIGEAVLRSMMDEADAGKKPYNCSVVKTNFRGIKFHQKLGISFVGETVSHYILQWYPTKESDQE